MAGKPRGTSKRRTYNIRVHPATVDAIEALRSHYGHRHLSTMWELLVKQECERLGLEIGKKID